MPRPKEINKDEIKLAIANHLNLHGPTKWPELMAQFPGVSRATFFRYIKEVRERIEEQAVTQSGAALQLAQKRIRSATESPDQTARKVKAHLPAAPSPAVIMDLGPQAGQAFDFIANFNRLMSDAEMMRNSSVRIDADGREKLGNPNLMDKSIGRRIALIETWLHSMEAVWNFGRLQQLYDMVIEEVGKASPEIQQEILARLRNLDNKRGMTINARIA